jgi:hypothetical protein
MSSSDSTPPSTADASSPFSSPAFTVGSGSPPESMPWSPELSGSPAMTGSPVPRGSSTLSLPIVWNGHFSDSSLRFAAADGLGLQDGAKEGEIPDDISLRAKGEADASRGSRGSADASDSPPASRSKRSGQMYPITASSLALRDRSGSVSSAMTQTASSTSQSSSSTLVDGSTDPVWHLGDEKKLGLCVADDLVRSESHHTFGNKPSSLAEDDNESVFTVSAYADTRSLRSRTSEHFERARSRTVSHESSRGLLDPFSLSAGQSKRHTPKLSPIPSPVPSPMSQAFSSASAPPQYMPLDDDDDDLNATPFSTDLSIVFDQEGWRETILPMILVKRNHITGELDYIPSDSTPLPYNAGKMQQQPCLRKLLVGTTDFLTRQGSLTIRQNGEWHVCGKEGRGRWMFSYRVEDRLRITGRVNSGEKVLSFSVTGSQLTSLVQALTPLRFTCSAEVLDPARNVCVRALR